MSLIFTTHVECDRCRERFTLPEARSPLRRLAQHEAKTRGWSQKRREFICKQCLWKLKPKITMADICLGGE